MNILVTGGAGYIGSHTCVELLMEGHEVIVVDNLCNSCEKALEKVEQICGRSLAFYRTDIRDAEGLREIFKKHSIDAVIHFAGLKAVGESVKLPLDYYENNIGGTLSLCRVMKEFACKNIIFSSSATVYGKPEHIPVAEDCPKGKITNPYGHTKAMIEQILSDLNISDSSWNIVLLRYFNPIGAHESGLIGEDPKDVPNNLLPYVAQVAVGRREYLSVYGDDYDTPDGTGIRDYIHVVDLARGHVKALERLSNDCGVEIYNLGTGRGYSVLEVVAAFERACGFRIPYKIAPRRAGDIACCFADPTKAREGLRWEARFDLQKMCEDTWRWQSGNPNGYR